MKPRLLDLFCGAGGAAMGYYRAGFEVIGVDIKPQKRYPFTFIQADALEYLAAHGFEFDVIHASPPCQRYSVTMGMHNNSKKHPDLIFDVRELLINTGKPYVIENVIGAPLINPLLLCGTQFGLAVFRHRLFECNDPIWFPPAPCNHDGRAEPMMWSDRCKGRKSGKVYKYITVAGQSFLVDPAKKAMGIDWMTRSELAQAIPPAFTEYIGRKIIEKIGAK